MLNPAISLVSSKIRPLNPEHAEKVSVSLPGGISYLAGQVLEEVFNAAATAVHTVTETGSPTGGTFQLAYPSANGYDVTVPIAQASTAATVQSALDTVIGPGNSIVTGSAGGPWTITYAGDLANRPIVLPTLLSNALTGGTTPSVTIASGTTGSTGIAGAAQAYASGNARWVLEANTRTGLNGCIMDQFGSSVEMTAPAWASGTELLATDASGVAQLVGLDTTAIPNSGTPGTLGKLTGGSAFSANGATIRIL